MKGFEPLHIYELSINPPPCLLEQHGRWKSKVEGHYAYQRQRLLQKPFAAWRDFIKTRRRKHVLGKTLLIHVKKNFDFSLTTRFFFLFSFF